MAVNDVLALMIAFVCGWFPMSERCTMQTRGKTLSTRTLSTRYGCGINLSTFWPILSIRGLRQLEIGHSRSRELYQTIGAS